MPAVVFWAKECEVFEAAAAAQSKKCQGLASRMLSGKRPRKRADPVPMWAVLLFELVAIFAECPFMRATAGYICTLIHARLRSSDGAAIVSATMHEVFGEDLRLIGGMLIPEAVHTNQAGLGGNTDEKKTMLLPIEAHLVGLSGGHWGVAFFRSSEGHRSL